MKTFLLLELVERLYVGDTWKFFNKSIKKPKEWVHLAKKNLIL